jgi:uncharacterized protein (TIGR03086 family)
MDPMTALDASAARVIELVGQLDESQWTAATPCPDWDVRELVGHLVATMRGHVDLLHGAPVGRLSALMDGQRDAAGEDPRAAVTEAAAAVRAALAEPGALERTVHHLIGDVPGSRLLQMRITENVVHAWDLATATGRPAAIDEALAEHVHDYLAPRAEGLPATGFYAAPRREAAPGAPASERLLALVGR